MHGRVRAPLPLPKRLQPPPALLECFLQDIPASARAAYAAAGAEAALAALEELTGSPYTGAGHRRQVKQVYQPLQRNWYLLA